MIYTTIQLSFLVFFSLSEALWISFFPFEIHYEMKDYLVIGILLACFFVPLVFYKLIRHDIRIVSLLETLFFTFAYAQLMILFSFFAATTTQPLIDSTLVSIDNYFGIYVPIIDFWFREHEYFQWIFGQIYNSYFYQILFTALYFSYYKNDIQLKRYVNLFMISCALTIVISGFFPALGPYDWYHYQPHPILANALSHLLDLRQNIVDLGKQAGIVTFPSFHAIMAMIYIYTFRNENKFVFIPILILNFLMIFSCIPIGEHYFADILGAIPVFLVTIGIDNLIYKRIICEQGQELNLKPAPFPTP
ncbi:Phosphatase PAP2 family protein [Candidatus Bealeia paramacronuclearis]|uniref:Phosphatase PAP2 family protein n=1 Tax=Candidatus Bealeia paramacronuclearis TaxID=1921001 RepID=A0ABZ2C3H4_9PROT|nr:Phosphatase PAP2 family protein [Candidatus Bealeia paramacronuclearis]